jgi:DNA-binding FrmR family transcriptional regulator
MLTEVREKVRSRLRKIAGQVEGIERMVSEDRYCVDVLHQIAAAQAALDKAGKIVLGAHVDTCVATALESGDSQERKRKLEELMEVFARFGQIRS